MTTHFSRYLPLAFILLPGILQAQAQEELGSQKIELTTDPDHHKVTVRAGGQPFTEFLYPDSLEKPVLYPIYAPDNQLITRGFPLSPRPGEPVDHPHHLGLWFNYENVNGLDFWNNSFAIPVEKKHSYGWIRTDPNSIVVGNTNISMSIGNTALPGEANNGSIQYKAAWTDQQRNTLIKEATTFTFSARKEERLIDRTTTLTAVVDVDLPDAKDGVLGLRLTKELQIPSNVPGEFVDDKGNITKVAAGNTPDINGNYITSEGKQGDSAWGTRATWCMIYGRKQTDTLSVIMIDHPANPGYPTYWHARGYGLFAANPLGQKIFSNGKESLKFHMAKGQSVTFRYRIVIAAGGRRLSTGRIGQLADGFARIK